MSAATPRTPDFTHLLLRDLTDYLIGRGFPRAEARKRASELLRSVEEVADSFRGVESGGQP